jgi:hypothetical protein
MTAFALLRLESSISNIDTAGARIPTSMTEVLSRTLDVRTQSSNLHMATYDNTRSVGVLKCDSLSLLACEI